MHRYRDSIVYNKKTKKNSSKSDDTNNEAYNDENKNCIFGAFVLFPYNNEEEFRNHKFYRSIDEVNIGAIPFLPSNTKLMEEFLNELIVESSYSTFERSLQPIGKNNYLQEDQYNKRNVLVGSLRGKEQIKANLEYNFYHTKKCNVDIVKHKVEWIALAQSKMKFKEEAGITYYGKVRAIEEVRRCDIKELEDKSIELYYKFKIEKWLKLDRKIEVKGYQVRTILYTTEYLLINAETVTELCIKEKEEFRIWKELKRAFKEIEIDIGTGTKTLQEESRVKLLRIGETDVIIESEVIKIIKSQNVVTVTKEAFHRRARYYLRELNDFTPGV